MASLVMVSLVLAESSWRWQIKRGVLADSKPGWLIYEVGAITMQSRSFLHNKYTIQHLQGAATEDQPVTVADPDELECCPNYKLGSGFKFRGVRILDANLPLAFVFALGLSGSRRFQNRVISRMEAVSQKRTFRAVNHVTLRISPPAPV